jgi:hypothetical protein
VTGGWRKQHKEEVHNLYFSPNITRMMKSRKMILVGHTVSMEEMRNAHKYWLENLNVREHSEDLGVDGSTI